MIRSIHYLLNEWVEHQDRWRELADRSSLGYPSRSSTYMSDRPPPGPRIPKGVMIPDDVRLCHRAIQLLPDVYREVVHIKYEMPGTEIEKRKVYCDRHQCGAGKWERRVGEAHAAVQMAILVLRGGG